MNQCKYRSMLRVPFAFSEEKQGDKLLEQLKSGGFDSVMFFNTPTHDIVGEVRHRAYAERLTRVVKEAKKLGLSVGIDILSTIGHHMESPDPALDGMDFMVEYDGRSNRGVYCPSSEKTFRALALQYSIYAAMDIDFLYIDDDMDYHCFCFCDRCIKEFAARSGVFSENGLTETRENLLYLLNEAEPKIRSAVLSQWHKYYVYRVDRLFKVIEKAAHAVRPSLILGMMPCNVGYNGCGQAEWAASLTAGGTELLARPGGGLYTDYKVMGALEKANNIGRELRYMPLDVKVQSEIENYPYQSLRKSARYTAFEALTYVNAGCSGNSFNFLSPSIDAAEEAERFFVSAKKVRPYVEKTAETFERNPSAGIGCYWDKETFAVPNEKGKPTLPFEDVFYRIGLPISYDPKDMCVFVMNEASAAWLPDEKIKEILSKGVLMNAGAAGILSERGFGSYIGFEIGERIIRNAAEYQVDHPLNFKAGVLRDAHLEFSLLGHSEFSNMLHACYSIRKTAEDAEVLSVLKDYDGRDKGISCGIWQNKSGGRVCVIGYEAFDWWYSLAGTVEIKNIFRWLSKDTIPAYVESSERVAIWPRKTVNGETGATIVNLSLDRIEGMKVLFKERAKKAVYVYSDCETVQECVVSCRVRPDGYTEVVLPQLPILGGGFIVLKQD